jgi:RimJ/RimL family protein N-acetyltransferase
MDQPEIAAGPLLLRPWRGSDADALVRGWEDPEVRRWGRYGAVVPVRENIAQWLDWNHEQWHFGLRAGFAISAADGDELVGAIMLRDLSGTAVAGQGGDTGEAGYWIMPNRRGRGAATLALGALSRWAFGPKQAEGLSLRRIELRHSVANPASCRVATKAGYAHEGTLRQSFRYADGAWHDEHLHARLFSDPTALGQSQSEQ